MKFLAIGILMFCVTACSSAPERAPASASRSGRPYQEPKIMNRHSIDTESIFQACLKEWPELYCRNRMGR